MNLLAIDTAYYACSVTLKKDQFYFSKTETTLHGQAEVILPFIDIVLKQAQLQLSDLHCLAFSAGPGSFTGIRLALSVIQGLSLSNQLPVVPVDSLLTLAYDFYQLYSHSKIAVCMNAYMGQLFWETFIVDEKKNIISIEPAILINPEHVPLLEGKNWAAVGNGWKVKHPCLEETLVLRCSLIKKDFFSSSAKGVVDLAVMSYERGETQLLEQVMPVYLREASAWKSLKNKS